MDKVAVVTGADTGVGEERDEGSRSRRIRDTSVVMDGAMTQQAVADPAWKPPA